MARIDLDQPLQASLLDRLFDANPDLERDPSKPRGQHLRELRMAVRRDLEALLNTRRPYLDWSADLTELAQSLVNYGIPDFSGNNLASDDRREDFRMALENVIRAFEPRFVSVSIKMTDSGDESDRLLRFRIEALMYAEPAPEPLVFDSVIDPTTQTFAITGGHND
jgi:type VI secretion system protein ImpF